MKQADLQQELAVAVRGVRLSHLRRLDALGVPMQAIASLGAAIAPFGVQPVRFLPGGLYEPDSDGEPAVIVPVHGPIYAGECFDRADIIDLLAFSSSSPEGWSWRTGDGWLLGEWCLSDAKAVVVDTPLQWLAHGGDALCVLNWSAPRSCWSDLRSMPSLRFTSETTRARVERALRQPLALPEMGIYQDAA